MNEKTKKQRLVIRKQSDNEQLIKMINFIKYKHNVNNMLQDEFVLNEIERKISIYALN